MDNLGRNFKIFYRTNNEFELMARITICDITTGNQTKLTDHNNCKKFNNTYFKVS